MNKESHMFKKIDWQSTKRLIFGSLLCISIDHFEQNKMFATIADRDVETMNQCKILLLLMHTLINSVVIPRTRAITYTR